MWQFLTRCIAAVALVFAVGLAQAETYALLIGINDYKDPVDAQGNQLRDERGEPISAKLNGAVNDANAYRRILVDHFGAKAENVRVLTDAAANEAGFFAGMRWLIESAKPGDRVFFSFSGHGGQIPSDDPREEDGLDEVIVLADDKLVIDDFFYEISKLLVERGVHATFLFDSCYSGGMSRAQGLVRRMNLAGSTQHTRANPALLEAVKQTAMRQTNPAATTRGSFAFVFAGQEDQPVLDISGPEITAHGVFTLLFEEIIREQPTISIEEALKQVTEVLIEVDFDQRPRAEYSNAQRARQPLLPRG